MFIERTLTGLLAANARRTCHKFGKRVGTSKDGIYFVVDGRVWFVHARRTILFRETWPEFADEVRRGIRSLTVPSS